MTQSERLSALRTLVEGSRVMLARLASELGATRAPALRSHIDCSIQGWDLVRMLGVEAIGVYGRVEELERRVADLEAEVAILKGDLTPPVVSR